MNQAVTELPRVTHVWTLHVNCTGLGTCSPYPGLAMGQRLLLLRSQEGERREGRKEDTVKVGPGENPQSFNRVRRHYCLVPCRGKRVRHCLCLFQHREAGFLWSPNSHPKPKAWLLLTKVTSFSL